jgi:hypothetical protein
MTARQVRDQLLVLAMTTASPAAAQTLQLGYDLRHTIDPGHNERDFVTGTFETFKAGSHGSLLAKLEADLSGKHNDLGKLYLQLSQSLKFWRFPVSLHLEYSGGIGVVGETETAYHIANTYSVGAESAFRLLKGWGSAYLAYRYTSLDRPSHDVASSFWWGRDLGRRVSLTGYFVLWTVNRNRGDAWTQQLHGKKLSGLGEPRLWVNLNQSFAVGSEVRLYYHVYDYADRLLVYPILAVKYQF